MITEIQVSYPTPTINIGGTPSKYSANIWFSVCIDSGELEYTRCSIKGVSTNNWSLEDIYFIKEVFKLIEEIRGKTIPEYLGVPL